MKVRQGSEWWKVMVAWRRRRWKGGKEGKERNGRNETRRVSKWKVKTQGRKLMMLEGGM
jgi:hypothetical protein